MAAYGCLYWVGRTSPYLSIESDLKVRFGFVFPVSGLSLYYSVCMIKNRPSTLLLMSMKWFLLRHSWLDNKKDGEKLRKIYVFTIWPYMLRSTRYNVLLPIVFFALVRIAGITLMDFLAVPGISTFRSELFLYYTSIVPPDMATLSALPCFRCPGSVFEEPLGLDFLNSTGLIIRLCSGLWMCIADTRWVVESTFFSVFCFRTLSSPSILNKRRENITQLFDFKTCALRIVYMFVEFIE